MQLEKLFKVLVMGGSALTVAACEGEPPPGQEGQPIEGARQAEPRSLHREAPDAVKEGTGVVLHVDAGRPDAGKADGGVSSWLHWF
jgi:hypothetical protein